MTQWQPPKQEPPKTKAELREMLAEAVRIGDVVRLKSGGPRMTVSVVMPTAVIAHWFDRAVLNTDRFSKQELSGEQSQQSSQASPTVRCTGTWAKHRSASLDLS